MPWANVFSVGACTVEVYRSGTLIAPADYADYDLASVEVVAGEVVVTGAEDGEGNPYPITGFDFRVVPQFATSGVAVRVAGVEMTFSGSGYNALTGAASWSGDSVAKTVPLSYSAFPISPYTPDPAVVTPSGEWTAAGILAGGGF